MNTDKCYLIRFFFADHEQLWAVVAVPQLPGKVLGWSWNSIPSQEAVGALQPPHSCKAKFPKATLFLSGFLEAVGGAGCSSRSTWVCGCVGTHLHQHRSKLIRWLQSKWSDVPLFMERSNQGNHGCLPQWKWGELNSLLTSETPHLPGQSKGNFHPLLPLHL